MATRPAAVAGQFYPGRPEALRASLRELMASAPADAAGAPAPKLLVVPHAGYVYSGPVAARAYACLNGARERIRRVVLLGPTHRVAVLGLAAPSVAAFETPLGSVRIDREALARIGDLPQVLVSDRAHAMEHALEVQLPFLQTALDAFTLVPLAVGRTGAEAVAEVLERLWGGDETLVVVSTDLSHYLDYAHAQVADRETVARILRLDPDIDHHQACGATPLAGALLVARRHGLRPRLLDLRNSGDTAGDRSRVVGYCAIAFDAAMAAGAGRRAEGEAERPSTLGPALLARARNAIAETFALPQVHEPMHPALRAPGASFVTLRRHGALRGCVGALSPERLLGDDVRLHALCAAFRDSRFEPLARHEFAELSIEVSLIEPSVPMPVRSEAEAHARLRPGIDGVVLDYRGLRATFLPQVWDELGEPREFLAALKRKAGLSPTFWSDDVRLSRYRVQKFTEGDRP
ncbi:MAG: AmmeMemoRadiSam system protein B [Burkholderiaceae bacterium]